MKVPTDIVLTHADPGEWAELQCYAALQPERGHFAGRAVMERVLGRRRSRRCIERRDVELLPDGRWRVTDWEFQEGDHTVNERMKRWRKRRQGAQLDLQLFPLVDVSRPSTKTEDSGPSGYGATVTKAAARAV